MMKITAHELVDQMRALDHEAVVGDGDCLAEADMLSQLFTGRNNDLTVAYANMTQLVRTTGKLHPIFLYGLQIGYRLAEAKFITKMVEGE